MLIGIKKSVETDFDTVSTLLSLGFRLEGLSTYRDDYPDTSLSPNTSIIGSYLHFLQCLGYCS
jgi:hypothetical protein